MRLRRSGASTLDESSLALVQVGEKLHPIPLNAPPKAEKILFGTMSAAEGRQDPASSSFSSAPANAAGDGAGSSQGETALDALARMQAALATSEQRLPSMPWSPDDLSRPHAHDCQPQCALLPHQTAPASPRLGHEPLEANLPPHYNTFPRHHSSSVAATRPFLTNAPTIFDGMAAPTVSAPAQSARQPAKQHPIARNRTTGHGQPQLDPVHVTPQSRPLTARPSSTRLPSRSSALSKRANQPLPPLPSDPSKPGTGRPQTAAASNPPRACKTASKPVGKRKAVGEEMMDLHKTNVRRPPKGIQNWFEAYLTSDDDETEADEEDEDEEEVDELARELAIIPPTSQPEPQELPADDILPPAYTAPSRPLSRASLKSGEPRTPLDCTQNNRLSPQDTVPTEDAWDRPPSENNSLLSIQSSHIGRLPPEGADSDNHRTQAVNRSPASPHGSDYDSYQEMHRISPPSRDTRNAAHATAAPSSPLEVQNPHRQGALGNLDGSGYAMPTVRGVWEDGRGRAAAHPSEATADISDPTGTLPELPGEHVYPIEAPLPPRPLGGQQFDPWMNTVDGATFHGSRESLLPPQTHHIMAVTEDERMVLDLMRRKRVEMRQLSFTEGYQLALMTEQQRRAEQVASLRMDAMREGRRATEPRDDFHYPTTSPTAPSAYDWDRQRQLSAISKEQVDDTFQIERFLGASQPPHFSPAPAWIGADPRVQHLATSNVPIQHPDGEVLPPTVYSPSAFRTTPPAAQQNFTAADSEDFQDIQRRVRQFVETNGAVPPLNTNFKIMRRKSNRAMSSNPPSPVFEEEHAPSVPIRSPDRYRTRELPIRSQPRMDISPALQRKQSFVSADDEQWDNSPISTFSPPMSRYNSTTTRSSHTADTQFSPELHGGSQSHDCSSASLPAADSLPLCASKPPPGPVPSPFSSIINSAVTSGQPISRSVAADLPAPAEEHESLLPAGVQRVYRPSRRQPAEAFDALAEAPTGTAEA